MALFLTNLKLLVIHHDTVLLNQIQQICDRYHYIVTKCTSVSVALNLLVQRYGFFDMMLIDVHVPNMDSYEFVQYVTQEHKIPVIVTASDSNKTSVIQSIIHGACDYWVQPLHETQFKIMWQHVARKSLMENKEHQVLGLLETKSHQEHQVLGLLDTKSHQEHQVLGLLETQSHNEHEVVEIMETGHERKREREDENAPNETCAKKSRLSWTPQLHQQFEKAVNQLGLDVAKPKNILKIMGVSGLTTAHVASHLQKYRDNLKKKVTPTECVFEIPAECMNKIPLESEHAQQSSQVTDIGYNYEAQHHPIDVGDYQGSDIMSKEIPTECMHKTPLESEHAQQSSQVTDIGYNYEAQHHPIDVGDYEDSDIMSKEIPTECMHKTPLESEHAQQSSQVSDIGYNYEVQHHPIDVGDYQDSDIMSKEIPPECIHKTPLESEHAQQSSQVSDIGYNYEAQHHTIDVGDYQVSDIMSKDFPNPSDIYLDLDDELLSLLF